jgi:hypothetical protein
LTPPNYPQKKKFYNPVKQKIKKKKKKKKKKENCW